MDALLPAPRQPIKILFADHHPLMRGGLHVYLGSQPDLEIVGLVTNGNDAVRLARRTRPDVILMDLQLPPRNAVATTARIVALLQGSRVLWFSSHDDENVLESLFAAGAFGFVSKHAMAIEVSFAIREVAAGRLYFRRDTPIPPPAANPTPTTTTNAPIPPSAEPPLEQQPKIGTLTARE